MKDSTLKVTILHEYGPKRHYEALYYLKEVGYLEYLRMVRFSVPYLIRNDPTSLSNELINLASLFFKCGENIIIGAAPYDLVIPYLLRLKEKNNVIYHTSWPFWDGVRHPKKTFLPYQKSLWRRFLMGLKTVTVTEAAKESIQKLGAFATHIPHCVNTKIFRPGKTKGGNTVVLYVGAINEYKGVNYLIEVIRKWRWKNVEFWFVGKGRLDKLIRVMQKRYPVRYFGYISSQAELAEIYRKADIFVLPTASIELFGIVLIEAMASGLPVVATNTIGPSEIIDHGKTGYLVPKKNVEALQQAISILVENPSLIKRMGMEGRKKALNKYEVSIISDSWKQVMKKAGFE